VYEQDSRCTGDGRDVEAKSKQSRCCGTSFKSVLGHLGPWGWVWPKEWVVGVLDGLSRS
jgi:hypothetical protein